MERATCCERVAALRLSGCPVPKAPKKNWYLRPRKEIAAAFDALTHDYTPLLRGFLLRRVPHETADDILQDTLLAAWTALPWYSHRARFKAWLFAIASRKCVDFYRARGRTNVEVSLEEVEGEMGLQKDAYAAVDQQQAIQSVLRLLPAEQREVIDLYYYAELSLPEVAQALERNLNTVKYQFYRAHTLAERELSGNSIKKSLKREKRVRKGRGSAGEAGGQGAKPQERQRVTDDV